MKRKSGTSGNVTIRPITLTGIRLSTSVFLISNHPSRPPRMKKRILRVWSAPIVRNLNPPILCRIPARPCPGTTKNAAAPAHLSWSILLGRYRALVSERPENPSRDSASSYCRVAAERTRPRRSAGATRISIRSVSIRDTGRTHERNRTVTRRLLRSSAFVISARRVVRDTLRSHNI